MMMMIMTTNIQSYIFYEMRSNGFIRTQ